MKKKKGEGSMTLKQVSIEIEVILVSKHSVKNSRVSNMLQNKCATSIQDFPTIDFKFSPPSSFLTVKIFCHSV